MEAGKPVQAKTTSLTTAADPRPVSEVWYIGGSGLVYRVTPKASVCTGHRSHRSLVDITFKKGVLLGLVSPGPSSPLVMPLSLPMLTNSRVPDTAGVPYTPK